MNTWTLAHYQHMMSRDYHNSLAIAAQHIKHVNYSREPSRGWYSSNHIQCRRYNNRQYEVQTQIYGFNEQHSRVWDAVPYSVTPNPFPGKYVSPDCVYEKDYHPTANNYEAYQTPVYEFNEQRNRVWDVKPYSASHNPFPRKHVSYDSVPQEDHVPTANTPNPFPGKYVSPDCVYEEDYHPTANNYEAYQNPVYEFNEQRKRVWDVEPYSASRNPFPQKHVSYDSVPQDHVPTANSFHFNHYERERTRQFNNNYLSQGSGFPFNHYEREQARQFNNNCLSQGSAIPYCHYQRDRGRRFENYCSSHGSGTNWLPQRYRRNRNNKPYKRLNQGSKRVKHSQNHRNIAGNKQNFYPDNARKTMFCCSYSNCNNKYETLSELITHEKNHINTAKPNSEPQQKEKNAQLNRVCKKEKPDEGCNSLELVNRVTPYSMPRLNESKVIFQCLDCPKHFNTKEELNRHSLVHTPIINHFICEKCQSKFVSETQLKYHMKSHIENNNNDSVVDNKNFVQL